MLHWGKNIGDPEADEIEFHFQHPHPLDATLWYYDEPDTWYLDLAWMNGGYRAGKEVEQHRSEWQGISEDEAKERASVIVREVINGDRTKGDK